MERVRLHILIHEMGADYHKRGNRCSKEKILNGVEVLFSFPFDDKFTCNDSGSSEQVNKEENDSLVCMDKCMYQIMAQVSDRNAMGYFLSTVVAIESSEFISAVRTYVFFHELLPVIIY